jgi:predicted metal-dependent peptidase
MKTKAKNSDMILKIDRARLWALKGEACPDLVFYGQLASLLDDEFAKVGTACTDGRRILWDERYLRKLNEKEVRYILLHEALHPGHGHLWRILPDDIGNIAGDYEIEYTLRDIPGIQMPKGGLICPKEFEGKAVEDIDYAIRHKPKPTQQPQQDDSNQEEESDEDDPDEDDPDSPPEEYEEGQGEEDDEDESSSQSDDSEDDEDSDEDDSSGGEADSEDDDESENEDENGSGGESSEDDDEDDNGDRFGACGGFTEPAEDEPPSKDPESSEGGSSNPSSLREQWEQAIIQASHAAMLGRGNTPADMQRILQRMRQDSIDWKSEMADFLKNTISQRNDWTRCARRHAWQKVIYPRRKHDDIATVIFARDASGSISNSQCSAFTTHISDCMSEMNCRALVVDWDTQIHAEYELQTGEECPLTAGGGGGTDSTCIFTRAQELIDAGERVAGVIVLTDLYMSLNSPTPDYPVLWISTNQVNNYVPFGRIVPMEPCRA